MLQLTHLNDQALGELSRQGAFPPAWTGLEELETRANTCVAELRERRHRLAQSRGPLRRLGESLDRALLTDAREYLDDPEVSEVRKLRIVGGVHLSNLLTRSYPRFLNVLRPLIRDVQDRYGRPARLLELASGSGGFALALARLAKRHELPVEIMGSDIVPAYVRHANELARRHELPVAFQPVDALDMRLGAGDYDILFIAQSMHHFTPGQLALMVAQARRVATTAFVGFDGNRSLHMLGFVSATSLLSLQKDMIHDAVITARKFYSGPELRAIARIAAPDAHTTITTSLGMNTILTVRCAEGASAAVRSQGRPRSALRTAFELARDPERLFAEGLARQGDPFRLRLPMVGDIVVTGHPEGAREVFSAPPDAFEPPPRNPVEPLLGAGSLILLAGERHARERKLMTPPFHGERMRSYAELIHKVTRTEILSWREGQELVLQDVCRRITLDVILQAVFGLDDPQRRERFRTATSAMLARYTAPLIVFPFLRRRLGGLGPFAHFQRAQRDFVSLLRQEIAERRPSGSGSDVLSLLLAARYEDGSALSPDELVHELSTLLVAGHETAATGLVWALYYALGDESIHRTLSAEVMTAEGAEALSQLPFLGAVCQEALRVHPVVPVVVRRTTRPFVLRGQEVAAGQTLAVALPLLHHHPEVWLEPARFWPQRFLHRKYSPFEYAPFGGGSRRCLGAAFATYEMKIVLGSLFAQARLALPAGQSPVPVIHNITMGPKRALRCTFLGRRGAA
jgi:cytochrome P450/SAM-dependent methyltransferase